MVKENNKRLTTLMVVETAVLTAIAYILYMFVKFPLPFIFPSFLDVQFSDLPALLCGFAVNPVCGMVVVVAKCLLKMPFSSTACIGEIADMIIGLAFVAPAAFYYKYKKGIKNAVIALIIGSIASVIVALIANRFLIVPYYVEVMFGGKWDILLNMMSSLFPNITQESFYSYYIWLSALPFNILRCFIASLLTFFCYKPLKKAIGRL